MIIFRRGWRRCPSAIVSVFVAVCFSFATSSSALSNFINIKPIDPPAYRQGSTVPTLANFFSPQAVGPVNDAPADVTCNLRTGVATGVGAGTCIASPASCNSVADDTAAIAAFATWATGTWQAAHTGRIKLLIPSGSNCNWSTFAIPFDGIKDLVIQGYGATLSGNYFHLAVSGQYQDNLHSTRLVTVAAGATKVRVNPSSASQPAACSTVAACVGLVSIGQWAMIAGIDAQAGSGFPLNPGRFQFIHITGVDTGTGDITFDVPLKDGYKSTWPVYQFSPEDHGGPATLFAIHQTWDAAVEWRGITFISSNQLDANARTATFTEIACICAGNVGPFASFNQTWAMYSSSMPGTSMEVDKNVETVIIDRTTVDQIGFQSANSIKNVTINNSTIRNIIGTPLNIIISNSIVNKVIPGATNYGATNSLVISNSAISIFPNDPGNNPGGALYKGANGDEGWNNVPGLSMTSGVITIPNSYIIARAALAPVGWAIPGNNLCWADGNNLCALAFQIVDLTQDATNTYVQTSLSGGLPGWPYFNSKLWIWAYPAAQFTSTNNTGAAQIVDLNSAPTGLPLFSWDRRTFNNAATPNPTGFAVLGKLKYLSTTVSVAYTGALAATATPNTLFSNYFDSTASALVSYTPAVVNLKVAGARTLDASGGVPASWTGAQSGDTLTTLSQQLFANSVYTTMIPDLSGDPSHPFSVTVEVHTDPGVVIPP